MLEMEQVQIGTLAADLEPVRRGRGQRMLRAMLTRPLTLLGAIIVLAFVMLAIFGPLLTPHDPTTIYYSALLSPPSHSFPFGTDDTGRDILSRVLAGARISLTIGLIATSIATVGGTILGLTGGRPLP